MGVLAAAIAVGLAMSGVVLALVIDDPPAPAPSPTTTTATTTAPDPAAPPAFLAAWERSRTGTYLVEGAYTQERAGAVVMDGLSRTVQRPPDRLVAQFGAVDGRLGGEVVGCAPTPDEESVVCRSGGPAPPYAEEVAGEMARLRSYVEGDPPLYRVDQEADGSCFVLTLARTIPAPPYGEVARFCFDPDTGAPVRQEVTRGDVVDRTVASTVRAPTDADLVLPDAD